MSLFVWGLLLVAFGGGILLGGALCRAARLSDEAFEMVTAGWTPFGEEIIVLPSTGTVVVVLPSPLYDWQERGDFDGSRV